MHSLVVATVRDRPRLCVKSSIRDLRSRPSGIDANRKTIAEALHAVLPFPLLPPAPRRAVPSNPPVRRTGLGPPSSLAFSRLKRNRHGSADGHSAAQRVCLMASRPALLARDTSRTQRGEARPKPLGTSEPTQERHTEDVRYPSDGCR